LRALSSFLAVLALAVPAFAETPAELEPVKVTTGKMTYSGLLQGWLVGDSTTPLVNFRLRRAEISLKGNPFEAMRWFLMIDPTKALRTGPILSANDNKILQDFGIGINVTPELELLVGQFKIPTNHEGALSSIELPLPERTISGRTFGYRREPGFMLTFTKDIFKVYAMLSNGHGTNQDDLDDKKDLNFRVEAAVLPGLLVGAFLTLGDFSFGQKGRVGGNVHYTLNDLTLRTEVIRARDGGTTSSTGWMADVSYLLAEKWLPVVRFDGIATEGAFTSYASTLGVSYLIHGHRTKATLAYANLHNMLGGLGTYSLKDGAKGDLFWLTLQQGL
jgi:hypothetical protein